MYSALTPRFRCVPAYLRNRWALEPPSPTKEDYSFLPSTDQSCYLPVSTCIPSGAQHLLHVSTF